MRNFLKVALLVLVLISVVSATDKVMVVKPSLTPKATLVAFSNGTLYCESETNTTILAQKYQAVVNNMSLAGVNFKVQFKALAINCASYAVKTSGRNSTRIDNIVSRVSSLEYGLNSVQRRVQSLEQKCFKGCKTQIYSSNHESTREVKYLCKDRNAINYDSTKTHSYLRKNNNYCRYNKKRTKKIRMRLKKSHSKKSQRITFSDTKEVRNIQEDYQDKLAGQVIGAAATLGSAGIVGHSIEGAAKTTAKATRYAAEQNVIAQQTRAVDTTVVNNNNVSSVCQAQVNTSAVVNRPNTGQGQTPVEPVRNTEQGGTPANPQQEDTSHTEVSDRNTEQGGTPTN